MTRKPLVIMARHSTRQSLESNSVLDARSIGQLSNRLSVERLPWRLIGANRRNTRALATSNLFFIDDHVAARGAKINSNSIASAQPCKAATRGALWRSV